MSILSHQFARPVMRHRTSSLAVAGLAVLALAGFASAPAAAQGAAETSLPFANQGGVRDWQADGDSKIYVQDASGKWYLATLAVPAPDLPFATKIGFETKGADRLDRFGVLIVQGARYPLSSLVQSGPPPAKSKR